MGRSNTDAWLASDAGDLKTEEVVVDVPNKGDTVLVRALPARYTAEVSSQTKMVTRGRDQYAVADVAEMEILQFLHGVQEPEFNVQQVRQIAEKWGPTFRKVIEAIDRISGIDKEAIEEARARFPSGGASETGADVGNGTAPGSAQPDEPVRAGAGPAHDAGGDR